MDQNDMELQENPELPVKESLKILKQKQKPMYKRKHTLGLIAFGLAMLAGLILAVVMGNALLQYLDKQLALPHIQLVMKGVLAAAILSVAALVVSCVTYAMCRQKKGFAIAATVISALIVIVCAVGIYAYHYMFGNLTNDEEFAQMSKQELFVAETKEDGTVDRDTTLPHHGKTKDEIVQIVEKKEEDTGKVVEWEYLTDEDLPQEALEKMNTGAPSGPSYLTGDHAKITNVALFGLDEIGSSDSVMIFSLDRVHRKLKLISIPRDSYVQVPAWGSYAKLAYPYTWGGAPWAVGTINHNFAMNITDYITVDTEQLAEIIDVVGGVDVDLDYNEAWCLRQFSDIHIGKCHLSGEAAVEYSRLRFSSATDNEMNRTGRQREVLISVLNTISQKSWTEYPEFVRACLGMCTTSFDNEQLLGMCAEVFQNQYTIEQYALIENMDYWGGKLGAEQYFYVVYDLNRASDTLYRLIYEDLYVSGYEEELLPE